MAIQDAERPGREHQQSGAGEEDAHQSYGEFALGAGETRSNNPDQVRREQDADENQRGRGESQNRTHRSCYAAGFLLVALGEEARVHRDK